LVWAVGDCAETEDIGHSVLLIKNVLNKIQKNTVQQESVINTNNTFNLATIAVKPLIE
jgi:hypothetical protein